MSRQASWVAAAVVFVALGTSACTTPGPETESPASESETVPDLATFTAQMRAAPGLLPLWVDARAGRIYAELDPSAPFDCLYAEGLAQGLGANPASLDRGELGATIVARFRVVGERALFEALNSRYRASSGDVDEARAAATAFPSSILAALPVVARDRVDEAGEGSERVLVDLEPLILRDAHGVSQRLASREEGTWMFEPELSAVEVAAARAFPDNIELEATLSFRSEGERGDWSGTTAPIRDRLGLRQHHSLIRLPGPGFMPREAPERMGAVIRSHLDFSAAVHEPLRHAVAIRHRLDPDEPLVYYLDRGTPEPIRSALIEGASWWAEAFAEAGFPEGFRVELLPEGVDPLDVRYNVINWVHRSTRGWSYGASVVDPRTGEILKANVTLGSQRIRQDRRIFEALLGAEHSGEGGPEDPVELALARIRQLAAHEVGHTLGFAHNFAASSYGRESVMDYPAPLVRLVGEGEAARIDVSKAYAVGMGAWDRLAFAYLYREWPSTEAEAAGLAELIAEADRRGLVLLSDSETHPTGAAHPEAAVWDNGADSVAELREVLAVRAHALARFGPQNLMQGAEPSDLELTLAPLYFFHRYQLQAAAKRIGGQRHSLASTLEPTTRPVLAAEQREALDALLDTLAPEVLALPAGLLELMRPTPRGYVDAPPSYAGPSFDPYAWASAAASMTIAALLEPERAHRLETVHALDAKALGYDELLDALVSRLWPARANQASAALLDELAREAFVESLVGLAANPKASPRVRALTEARLSALEARLSRVKGAHDRALAARISRWLGRAEDSVATLVSAPPAPPGSPIGASLGCGSSYAPWSGQSSP